MLPRLIAANFYAPSLLRRTSDRTEVAPQDDGHAPGGRTITTEAAPTRFTASALSSAVVFGPKWRRPRIARHHRGGSRRLQRGPDADRPELRTGRLLVRVPVSPRYGGTTG